MTYTHSNTPASSAAHAGNHGWAAAADGPPRSASSPTKLQRPSHSAERQNPLHILCQLPATALTAIGQQLSPREIGRLGQTCSAMHAVQQRMMMRINDLQMARSIAGGNVNGLNAAPAVCVRLEGRLASVAAAHLKEAPWVTRLDVRSLEKPSATDLIALANLHPNARIVMTPAQQRTLLSHYLREESLSKKPQTGQTTPTGAPFEAAVKNMPLNLVGPCAIAACSTTTDPQGSGLPRPEDGVFARPPHCWSSKRLSQLAIHLLARSESESPIPGTARLLLATTAISTFPWNTEVHPEKTVLLMGQLAYALSEGQSQDALPVHFLLTRLAIAMESEHSFKASSRLPDKKDTHTRLQEMSPYDILATLMAWGVDPLLQDANGLTVIDHLKRKHHFDAAKLMNKAIRSLTNSARVRSMIDLLDTMEANTPLRAVGIHGCVTG